MSTDWTFPYASRRSPVLARNVVATSQPLAAEAGLQMLRRGGNAVDAALASAIALTVVEPTGNGLGSDAFAIVWDGRDLHGLNASGRSPAAWSPARFAAHQAVPLHGWESVTVPGAVDAWVQLSERFGTVPFAELFAPALELAHHGFHVSPVVAARWHAAIPDLGALADFARDFLPQGRAPRCGERFRLEGQAQTLEEIAATRGESFYRGALAEKIAAHAKRGGSALGIEDLAAHRSDWVACIEQVYRTATVQELPPNGQGLATLIALGVLEQFDIADYDPDGADSLHLQIEAMKIGLAEAARHVSDPDSMQARIERFLDPDYLRARAQEIDPRRAAHPRARITPDAGTVYLATADAAGMMVSLIQSNYHGFGSGVVVPGTGISLQNRGAGFVLEAGHPNCVAGAKRPFHTIIPGFVSRGGAPVLAFGVMGGHMQAQGHLQMVVRLFDYAQNPQAASDAPRWYLDTDFRLGLEAGTPPRAKAALAERGHVLMDDREVHMGLFGGAQLVARLDDGGYCAASDHRKDGQAVGF